MNTKNPVISTVKSLRHLLAAVAITVAHEANAQATVTATAGRLTVRSMIGDQNLKFVVPSDRVVEVFGIPGVPDGTRYSGINAIDVMTGAGSDNIEFDIQTSRSLSVLSNTGDGQAETKVQWQVLPSTATVTSRLTLNSGNGPTKTVMGFVGEAANNIFAWNMRGLSGNKVIDGIADFKAGGATATANVNFNLGTGAHVANLALDSEVSVANMNVATGPNVAESITSIITDDPSSALNVVHTSRSPKSVLNVVSAAANLDVDIFGDHLGAQNDVSHTINQIQPGTVSVFYDLDLADGADKLDSIISASGSAVSLTGAVRAYGGNDIVNIVSEGASTTPIVTLDGGFGSDYLTVDVKGLFQLSQSGGTVLLGGAGNDFLTVRTDTGIRGTGFPNDVVPRVDGGLGFDLNQAFGLILNCEGGL